MLFVCHYIVKIHRTTYLHYSIYPPQVVFSHVQIEMSLRALHYKEKVKEYSFVAFTIKYINCHFRLWRGSAPVKNFGGLEQYDWLQNGFFIGQDLVHYGQDFYGEELQPWMKQMTWLSTCQHAKGCKHGKVDIS